MHPAAAAPAPRPADRRRARLAVTPGEPAGIGPDLCVLLAQREQAAELVAVADPNLLAERAERLGLKLRLRAFDPQRSPAPQQPGTLLVDAAAALAQPAQPGRLERANAGYVLDTLTAACRGCRSGRWDALVTGPVHKGVINDAGTPFSGHTEFLADCCDGADPVMMLATPAMRVALATTHLPLAAVPAAITRARLERVIRILAAELSARFGIAAPHILVCGLNPHAGEGGHLGTEEIEVIAPALEALRGDGLRLTGPLPADTLFTPTRLAAADAVLAMYHDQGLPVLKYSGFGRAVNITLGLPIIRTSVDHGTALELAGSGSADAGSLEAALAMAARMVAQERARA